MYGTLLAATGLQHLVRRVGTDSGLLSSSNCPCAFGHSSRDLDMVVHSDGFYIAGDGDDLNWLSQKLNEKLELARKARLGTGYDSEATVLNSCVTYSDSGLTWEADPQHAELAVAELGLQAARPQTSPRGAKPNKPMDHEELEPDGQKAHHSVSARLSFLSADRPVVALACKECSRTVGKATRADLTRLKRIGRYLLNNIRIVCEFLLQREKNIVTIDGLSDADAAGCPKTRRSTSGGCLRVGQHTLATWSSTEKVVLLSSVESEYYSMVRCAGEAIGLANTIQELGHQAQIRIWTNAAAARGLALRSRSGTIKHMETKYFWLQQKEKNQELRIERIRGTVNPADLMTEHLDGKRLVTLCELLNIKRVDGRPR